jgi:hypothetical protein
MTPKPRFPIGPFQLEAIYQYVQRGECREWHEPLAEVWITSKRIKRDLLVVVEYEGKLDPVLAMMVNARVYARCRAKHIQHLAMMRDLLRRAGYVVTLDGSVDRPRPVKTRHATMAIA